MATNDFTSWLSNDEYRLRRLSRQEVRSIDQTAIERFGMSGLVLMENAGRGAAEAIAANARAANARGGRVMILCGKGNNAGDGFVVARHLEAMGLEVQVLQCVPAEGLSGDAATQWLLLQESGTPILEVSAGEAADALAQLEVDDIIVDALLGTGATGALRDPFDRIVASANAADSLRVALDLPSGFDCDLGKPAGACFEAHQTLTFVAPKIGFAIPGARRWVGQVRTIPIGVPRCLLKPYLLGGSS